MKGEIKANPRPLGGDFLTQTTYPSIKDAIVNAYNTPFNEKLREKYFCPL